ncbi:helix-turn-helix domain-containing protein [Paenibacillus chitinolyticus]|uniref:helix-turn-helix domain-containing protein n=1 Tax=Paenibacillus chitinolyticus TaxID=79263 RepID=UPI0036DB2530
MEVFSQRVKWLREQHGYTQKKMAELLGMTQSGYAKIEYGEREPNLETLVKFPKILHEPLDFLLGLNDTDKKCRELEIRLIMALEYALKIDDKFNKATDIVEKNELFDLRAYVNGLAIKIEEEYIEYGRSIPCISQNFSANLSKREQTKNFEDKEIPPIPKVY